MFVRTDDYTLVNLDRFDQVLVVANDFVCDSWIVGAAKTKGAKQPGEVVQLFGPCKDLEAKTFIDLLNSALLRGAKCMDVRA